MTKKPQHSINSRRPLLFSLATLVFLLLFGFFMLWQQYQIQLEERQDEMTAIIDVVEQNIDQSLKYSYSAALSLALQIDKQGKIDNFEEVAAQLVDSNSNIDGIETVPKGIIKEVYPYEEHKAAINYNILADSARNDEAFKAIQDRKMFFAGPFELKQGGFAIVGRLPVFIKDDFWGFTAVIIYFENLVKQSGLDELVGDKYYYQISKVNPVSKEEEFFIQGVEIPQNAYSEEIILPDGDWKVYIIPQNPNEPIKSLLPIALLVLVISVSLAWIIYDTMKQPAILEERVKKQAGKLAESELRFRTIFNQAGIGMARMDSNSGMFLETNKRFRQLLGYNQKELKRLSYKDVSHPRHINENARFLHQLRNNEIREFSLEKRLKKKNGESVWVRLNVAALWKEGEKASNHIALIEDISARVKAKNELVENEKRFRSLVENSNEVILIVNKKGEAVYHSPSFKRITGYDELFCSGNDIFSLVHPADIRLFFDVLRKSNNNPGRAYQDVIMRVKTRGSNYIWVNMTLTNMIHEKSIEGFVVNFRNITEKKEAELNLVKSFDLVTEQNKRLLNFAYIVSHNLRSHSSNLQSILDLYEVEDDPDEKDNYIALLFKVAENLDQSLRDLNEVVSINTNLDIKVEPLKMKQYLDQVLELLSLQINSKNAEIEIDIPEEMVVNFNTAYLESILLNLLTNALKYSHPQRIPKILIRGYKKLDQWVLEIRDNGIGIDLDKHGDKIFGLYKTFSGRKDARGVGLFITKNQINAMGGTVSLESKPGKGSIFKVMFK